MSIIKKMTAMLTMVTMIFTFAACADTSYAGKSGDLNVPAGVYIYYQMTAYQQATSKVEDVDNFAKSVIEGKDVADWINDVAIESVKSYIAVDNKFNELGLDFTEQDSNIVNVSFKNSWDTNQKVFEKNGIGEVSLKAIITNDMKKDKIFNFIYGEGGEKATSSESLNKYFHDNYLRIQYIPIQLKTGSGEAMSDEQKKAALEMAEDYKNKILQGVDFYKAYLSYVNYYTAEVSKASGETIEDVEYDENHDPYELEDIIKKGSGVPNEKMNEEFFKAKAGELNVIKDEAVYYVAQRLELNDRPELFEDYKASLLYELKGEEFTNLVKEWTTPVEFEKNEAAYKRYNPLNIVFDVK